MGRCRTCGAEVEFGWLNERWVPLEPATSHDDLDRTYVDENGVLRADHRDRHSLGTVAVQRLERKVPAAEVATRGLRVTP